MEIKVKPLAWREVEADGVFADRVWISETYAIELRIHAEVFDLFCVLWDSANAVRFDDLEAAKAAAQADYETRIRSAIIQPTLADALALPEVKALVDAIRAEPTEIQIASACLSYRHDFGLLSPKEREITAFEAKEWLHAWKKELFSKALAAIRAAIAALHEKE